ncbi:MAG: hypothetical protein EOO42_01155 [Flavobacteriales bacterium]|nr:MAG: hypothetical protein EOO42_01155 [Flavobacteriales bacterium]
MDTIDGVLFSSLGIVVSAWNDFLKMPELKQPYFNDWPDQNGIEPDLTEPIYKHKVVSVSLAMVADNETEYWNNYRAFFNILSKPGLRRLYISDYKRSFFVYYTSNQTTEQITNIAGKAAIGVKGVFQFTEPVPSLMVPYAFLTKKSGGYLLTHDNKLINLNI